MGWNRSWLMVLAIILVVGFALASPALACPPEGCVEIMAHPEGESWGYVDVTADTGRPYHNAVVTSVAVGSIGGSEVRRISVQLATVSNYEPEDGTQITYSYRVKEYDSSTGALLATSSATTIAVVTEPASAAPVVCDNELRMSNGCPLAGWWTCWLGGCSVWRTCPGVGCLVWEGGCSWQDAGYCQCDLLYGGTPTCADPQLVAQHPSSGCQSGRTCVVEVSDTLTYLW